MTEESYAQPASLLTELDIHLFKEGKHTQLYNKLGAHLSNHNNQSGTMFAVWAPDAEKVSVMGDFNHWNAHTHYLYPRHDRSGVWEGFIPDVQKHSLYKYHIWSRHGGYEADKGDPFAIYWETPPATSSVVWDLGYVWHDQEWIAHRKPVNALDAPLSIYEVHLGSWMRVPEQGLRALGYIELAQKLTDYVKHMGYTHVELLPIMEHPFYGSWGYQTTGYFAPTARYGTPQDLMHLIDTLHCNGIGVIMDWVPSHFPSDLHGLAYFDGTHLFEHQDPRRGFHQEWNSYIFNYGRNEVRSFLISSALFWLNQYHVDGLRVDAVASMLYLDYARKPGEWIPNIYGGREDIDAVTFIQNLNEAVYREHPDTQTIAEESTAWPRVSRPVDMEGLGFGMKWNMGWMHDTLEYMQQDPVHRQHHHNQLIFSLWYAFAENFLLPQSHDEVVYGKGSLLRKMPGDYWQKFANLRLLYAYMFSHPGKKLLFMGCEFAQWNEWNHEASLDWHLLDHEPHQGVQNLVKDLNDIYRHEKAMHELDFDAQGFEWIECNDWQNSVISFIRYGRKPEDLILVVCNFTPVLHRNYRIGIPQDGTWKELLNTDAERYGGSGIGNPYEIQASPLPAHGRYFSLTLTVPPLGVLYLKPD